MSKVSPAVAVSAGWVPPVASASRPEKSATSSTSPSTTPTPAAATSVNLRSCAVCRSRKVRCNKESPCSNCRKANIACVFPSADRPPRWARRLERTTANSGAGRQNVDPGARQVMARVRNLESLVKELNGQLEQAHAAAAAAPHSAAVSSGVSSPGNSSTRVRDADGQIDQPPTSTGNIQKQFGMLVLNDASRSRYVGSGFWSRINDELDGLKMDTNCLAGNIDSDTSEDEGASLEKSLSTQELARTPSERHAFLFRHGLEPSGPELAKFQPLPSQVLFLLDVFSENVNALIQVVHMPTIKKMVRSSRSSGASGFTPANDALMLSIYYAAVTSMEDDEITRNFGSTKTDLNLNYRLRLEHALAEADFLNVPDLALVQAFSIFLFLARLHDSPRFVWMMTGLAIRMAHALGLHRDGSRFDHLTPFEVEMRRRVWWALCMLDVRSSEDQGTELTIISGSFDTRLPANINDADIDPETKQTPTERQGNTDATIALVTYEICDISRRMHAPGVKEGPPGLEEQSRLLEEMRQKLEPGHLRYSRESGNITDWIAAVCLRIVVTKMTLITHLPALFNMSPSEDQHNVSEDIRNKLLVSAIEVAEHNHALNAEPAAHHWRWIYQTYTHWHAIVFLLLELCRRPYTPTMERAWAGLHSPWLIPQVQLSKNMDKNLRVWFPLRKLMAKARQHRDAELERLHGDTGAARRLEAEDQKLPMPTSAGLCSSEASVDVFRERWRGLVGLPREDENDARATDLEVPATSYRAVQPQHGSTSLYGDGNNLNTGAMISPLAYMSRAGRSPTNPTDTNPGSAAVPMTPNDAMVGPPLHNGLLSVPADFPGFCGVLWADMDRTVDVFANVDIDVNMDLDTGEIDWYHWVESAKNVEWDAGGVRGGGSGG